MRALLLPLALVACGRAVPVADTPGARLEAAALARGLVADPARGTLIGSWASDTDRLCVVASRDGLKLGASVDYGEGQSCAASGSVSRSGDRLRVTFGSCRFAARYDGERITFPPDLPAACETLCTGRASLTALTAERLSDSASEAATLRSQGGQLLCGG